MAPRGARGFQAIAPWPATNAFAGADHAPQWPPSAPLVANPPSWGAATPRPPTSPQNALALWTDADAPTESPAPLPVASPTPDLPLIALTANKRRAPRAAPAPGFYIGADGTEWPLPPPECMPPSLVAPCAPLTLNHLRALSARRKTPASRSPPRRAAPGATAWPTDASPFSSSDASPASSTDLATPPGLPAPVGGVARAGALPVGYGRPVAIKARVPASPLETALGLDIPLTNLWNDVPEEDSDVPGEDSDEEEEEESGYVLGLSGMLWPRPPKNPRAFAGVFHRGRNPVPKW